MNQRKKLIELIEETENKYIECIRYSAEPRIDFGEFFADRLIAEGVIVPPCKVGDTVYYITGIHGNLIKEANIVEIYYGESGFAFRVHHGYSYFDLQQRETYFTREEAEKALAERSGE